MKNFILFYLVASCLIVNAQDRICYKVERCDKEQKFTLINRVENEVKIFVEGEYCDSLKVTVNKGEVKAIGCSFYITPNLESKDTSDIYSRYPIYVRTSNQDIDTFIFDITDLDTPYTILNGFNKSMGYQSERLDKIRLLFSCDIGAYRIDSFTFEWIRQDSIFLQKRMIGDQFNAEVKKQFDDQKRKGDIVKIRQVWYTVRNQSYVIKETYLPCGIVERD